MVCLALLFNPGLWGHVPASYQNFEGRMLVGTVSNSRVIWETSEKQNTYTRHSWDKDE